MNTWLSAIMLVSAAAGFAVCAGGVQPRGRRRRIGRAGVPRDGIPFDGVPFDGVPFDGVPFDGGGTPVTAVVGMAGMLAAMADMTLDVVHVLPGVVWGLLMLLGGPLLLAAGPRASSPSHRGFGMHRSLSMIATAGLMIAGGHGDAAGSTAVHAHGSGGALPILAVLLVVGVAALLAYTVVLVVGQRRVLAREASTGGGRLLTVHRPVVETCLAAVSIAAMAGSTVV